MAKNLEPGDVFYAHHDMFVYYEQYPCCFYNNESLFSTRTTDGVTNINALRKNRTDASKERARIAAAIEDIFKKEEAPLDLDILHRFVRHQVRDPESKSLMTPEGYYIVTKLSPARTDGTANCTARPTILPRQILKPAFIFTRKATCLELAAGLLQWTSARFQKLVNKIITGQRFRRCTK